MASPPAPLQITEEGGTASTPAILQTTEETETASPPAPLQITREGGTPSLLPSLQITVEGGMASTATPTREVESRPTACPPDYCQYSAQFFLQRPIALPGNDTVDVTYRFGNTQGGMRDPHHGVEFLNKFGTPVLAAADGVVVVAGDDTRPTSPQGAWPITFYGPYSNFYGNVVVIEHAVPPALLGAFPDMPQPVYTLYGHLSEIEVQVGQPVKAGQEVGKVGQAGIATGPHLHFEVRLGENSYKASRNPELWLRPHQDASGQAKGALAGRFIGAYGDSLEMESIVLQHLPQGADGPSDFEVTVITYEEKGLRDQTPWLESFAASELPAGLYRVSFPMGGLRRELVQVLAGQLTVVTFRENKQ